MRALVERVTRASVSVEEEVVGRIERGLVVYVGVADGDEERDAEYLSDKVRHLRVFSDEAGKLNRDVVEVGGAVLAVSAFSLMADARQGRRPAFDAAAPPEPAERLYGRFCEALRATGVQVETGQFRRMMRVEASNDGPICMLLDSRRQF